MAKTKIVVLQMKELIYTAIFAGFLILLIVLLIIMFTPSGKKDKSSDASTGSLYQPGVYHSQVSLGDTTLNIELVTDSDQIKKQLKTSQLFHFLFAVVIAILVMVVVYRLGALAINRYVSQPYIIESPATVITGPLPTDTP